MTPFTTAIVLVCTMSMPPDKCTDQTALHRMEMPLTCSTEQPQFNPSPLFPAMNSQDWKDGHYYFKTRCLCRKRRRRRRQTWCSRTPLMKAAHQ